MTKAIKYYLVTLETKKGKREARQKLVELLDQRHNAVFSERNHFMLFLLDFIEKIENINKLQRLIQMRIRNPAKLLRWSFLQK